jgi:dienelactone hydrolase
MKICILFFSILFFVSLQAQVTIEHSPFADDASGLKGVFTYDKLLKSKRGGVLLLTDRDAPEKFIAERAEQLGNLGYVVCLPELYSEKEKKEDSDASPAENAPDPLLGKVQAALALTAAHARVDPERIVALGYGSGGSAALELARSGAEIKAAINYFGGLKARATGGSEKIKSTILVLLGSEDPDKSQEEIQGFREEMRTAAADWQMNIYGGAVNSFTYYELGFDTASGRAYNFDADRRSWEAVVFLLHEKLK